MPDYNDKNIPVLDDIIEIDVFAGDKDRQHVELENESLATDDNPELFSKEIVHSVADTDEPRIGEIEGLEEEQSVVYRYEYTETETEIIDTPAYQPETEDNAKQTDEAEPALIHYQQEQAGDVYQAAVSIASDEYQNSINDSLTGDKPQVTKPLALETIVDDVVKQLIPDLEQQLRYLVQQALEDRLPAELLSHVPVEEDDA